MRYRGSMFLYIPFNKIGGAVILHFWCQKLSNKHKSVLPLIRWTAIWLLGNTHGEYCSYYISFFCCCETYVRVSHMCYLELNFLRKDKYIHNLTLFRGFKSVCYFSLLRSMCDVGYYYYYFLFLLCS